ncbi:Glyoxalase-like domain containing protein [Amanita muscaria]
MANIATNILDHIVHLVPPRTLDHATDTFRQLGFNVLVGGTHAGGLTANSLVIFPDGVYFEIISFTEPVSHYPPNSPERRKRENHTWANKAPGWIDYAFLGNGSQEDRISTLINDRAENEGSDVRYRAEVGGGRTRTDGIKLEWLITAPKDEGLLPFFCGDVTPRDLRVPAAPDARHPSGATGIAFVRVVCSASSMPQLVKNMSTVVGKEPRKSSENRCTWELQSVEAKTFELILSAPLDDGEVCFVQGCTAGIYEIGIKAARAGGTVETPYGKLTWVPLPDD